ncbi:DUF3450 domain-containing protein [uncultured Nevskia sp.]|uniref:DUF3450 domain-containing protein n=1 Tax=uncultured Nevskia sp. TaxID=228950 RepID=UPI0025DC432C|nr:DUF3450 domain-containing protein [uncultured Nevskia sp.]
MSINLKKLTGTTAAVLLCALYLGDFAIAADAPVKAAIGEQSKAEESGKNSQKRIDQMDDAVVGIVANYRQALTETSSLKDYNDQLATQTKSQDEEIAALNGQLAEIDKTAREVTPLMSNMLATLDTFVKLDTPFLPDERAKRIAGLKEMMGRADISVSEKYRRIVEGYQIESEYGRTIEAYQGKVDDKTVDFIRAGRVALLYQTLDGKETGFWDADAKAWKIDNSFEMEAKSGLKIAKKQAAPDFLFVPVHAPVEAK